MSDIYSIYMPCTWCNEQMKGSTNYFYIKHIHKQIRQQTNTQLISAAIYVNACIDA